MNGCACAVKLKAIINSKSMIVCSCKGLNERAIQAVIREGACSVQEIGRRCGAGTDCGCCRGMLREMIEEHEEAASTHVSLPLLPVPA